MWKETEGLRMSAYKVLKWSPRADTRGMAQCVSTGWGVSNVCSHCLPSPWRVAAGHCTLPNTYVPPTRNTILPVLHARLRLRDTDDELVSPKTYRRVKHVAQYRNRRVNRRTAKLFNSLLCHANRGNEGRWVVTRNTHCVNSHRDWCYTSQMYHYTNAN